TKQRRDACRDDEERRDVERNRRRRNLGKHGVTPLCSPPSYPDRSRLARNVCSQALQRVSPLRRVFRETTGKISLKKAKTNTKAAANEGPITGLAARHAALARMWRIEDQRI